MLIPFQTLDDNSRVWIFQAENELSPIQATEIKSELFEFLQEWTAHNAHLHTSGEVLHHRFVVVMVDESQVGASGCSIDKLTHFIQNVEQKYNVTLLDRMSVAYITSDDKIAATHLNQLGSLLKEGKIDEETLVFNNLVGTKSDFETKWKIKIKDSWHKRFL